LEETGAYLGIGIANLINTFNPDLVVFGGILALASDYLLPAIRCTVAERALAWPRRMAEAKVSAHGLDACVMGGVALVLNDILSSRAWLRKLRKEEKREYEITAS